MEKQLPLFPVPDQKPSQPMPEQPHYQREYCEKCKRERCVFWRGRAWCVHCEERELFPEDVHG